MMPHSRNSRLILSLQPSRAHLLAQYLSQCMMTAQLRQFKELCHTRAHIWCADDAGERSNVNDTRAAVARCRLDEERKKSLSKGVSGNQRRKAHGFWTFVTATWPRKFTFITSMDILADIHSIGPAMPIPALLTSAYMSPQQPDTTCAHCFKKKGEQNMIQFEHPPPRHVRCFSHS